ncbi:MAG: tRNA uridine-5-carboxymethylaminomethyl(34) synthesis GTPase MnmE [Clostridia bacterium]|nr:tRNA uridine-5-carboxymethylaminomethyl(34) synthesis GTPase MnmE [Clostridia bacterium]
MPSDTIVALATPPGQGGVAIVRISGPRAEPILNEIFRPREEGCAAPWPSHQLILGWVGTPENPIDEVMAVLMRAPRSYTREDVAEIHCHGAPYTVREILRLAVEAGARPAEPGEFTRRAFENGRIDLAQAEAVMTLIGAQGERAARDALRQMRGGASRVVLEARAQAVGLLAGLEAALDFSDEIDEGEATAGLRAGAAALAASLRASCDPRAEKLLREGLDVVIAGRPNAGKSTLLNALLGEDRAIVTDLPGTTRDTLTERLELDGLIVQLTDTAGLREGGDAIDIAEERGVARARAALERADLRLIVLDASMPLTPQDEALLAEPCEQPRIVVLNKCDIRQCTMYNVQCTKEGGGAGRVVEVSALTGQGVPALLDALRAAAALPDASQPALTRARHIDAATRAAEALEAAVAALDAGLPADVAAIDLRCALDALGGITGETLSEDVIDAIFANFCVGK